jgi:hypothetical protein
LYFSLYETSRDQLKVSLPTGHRLIRAGALDVVKIGRRTFITKESVERLVAGGDPRPGGDSRSEGTLGLCVRADPRAEREGAAGGAALDLIMAPETWCVDGWVCEIHPDESCVDECGVGMPCPNPTCPLPFDTESDPAIDLV